MTSAQALDASYDAVVIGAGNGGLAAATQLAAKGAEVLLLEQHNLPGGYATSFVRGRFEFEAALHLFCDIGPRGAPGDVRRALEDDLGLHLDWVEVPASFRLILTDPREHLDIIVPYGAEAFVDSIEREVPGSREAVANYVALCRETVEAITYIGRSRGSPDRKVLTGQYGNFLRTAAYTVDEVARALKVPDKAKKILHAQWSYLGPPTSRLNFTVYAAMLYKFLRGGAYIPQNRSHGFVTALDARIRELGGRVEYNTRVEQILVKDGAVVGVTTAHGDKIATRHVISNASPTVVYNHMISPATDLPTAAYQECNARQHGLSGFVVYLGLDTTLQDLGIDEYHMFVYDNMDTDAMYASFGTLDAPRVQAVMGLNNALPDCSPPGTSILSTTTLYRPEAWSDVGPADYVAVKNKIAADLISDLEEALDAPISEHIEEIEIATPQTFARYTGAFGGGIYGYEPEPWDSIMPRLMTFRERFIEGLDFGCGYAFRCHGYSSSFLSGQTSALVAYRDMLDQGEVAQ
jgi:prolycopene isomerase